MRAVKISLNQGDEADWDIQNDSESLSIFFGVDRSGADVSERIFRRLGYFEQTSVASALFWRRLLILRSCRGRGCTPGASHVNEVKLRLFVIKMRAIEWNPLSDVRGSCRALPAKYSQLKEHFAFRKYIGSMFAGMASNDEVIAFFRGPL